MEREELEYPQLLAAAFIATPLLFFLVLVVVGPLANFAAYLFLSWTIAAVISGLCFAITPSFQRQLSSQERLAVLAGNGLVALFVALAGGLAWSVVT